MKRAGARVARTRRAPVRGRRRTRAVRRALGASATQSSRTIALAQPRAVEKCGLGIRYSLYAKIEITLLLGIKQWQRLQEILVRGDVAAWLVVAEWILVVILLGHFASYIFRIYQRCRPTAEGLREALP
ncbi:MAG: hypothetical protein ACE5HV_13830 [Acidobacteriota bacterium]